ncbi:MAG: tRNA uridine-5-carboxymethylaminomethyl(34) synthesis GTPase MnmE [Sphingomonas sp.]|uniref:tRNA uridine-5-carboxymethylaminomethyl(34) synthesis GTPase MnmE n=1 Tax=Sphingomonas sp. TaxID=28214 RepID=UPI0025E3F9CB|nr:tRNA uridine-5-carboxymethylaminomethyl(34) synthesis GTPase MnmE [Sphingomonas sp.]MBX9881477.1 tRNA uridine-5-carboxymethylaminomethyl(34) synthesis GTPase MnmE [Sphingomonas sp.]
MPPRASDTIFAVASGPPPAAIAVMRVSGPAAFTLAETLAGALPAPRRASLRTLRGGDGTLLDRALVLVFPGPNSASGEDLVELHLHGARAVVAAVSAALAAGGGRLAEPGEFTRRALMNGRIDLAQAEGLGDLLMAETESARRAALGTAEGAVSRRIGAWGARLLEASALIEAALDFADEDDVGELPAGLPASLAALAEDMRLVLAAPPVERLRDGVRVVLAGPPNAGKSTLLNALAEREAAIVSPIAGTTRDRIEVPVVRDGIAYLLIDTAGLAETTDDPIEAIGIARARAAAAEADILLWLDDSPPPAGALWLYPRADERPPAFDGRLALSARTGAGVDQLWSALADRARAILPRADQLALNARQRQHVDHAAEAVLAASAETDLLIAAEQCRLARRALDAVTGATGTEAMLDALFGRFCIGK